ncbi:MAG: TolC family protein [Bryobacterales bacterium]|nr:TolC family protein [Bryobacterales bacterium]
MRGTLLLLSGLLTTVPPAVPQEPLTLRDAVERALLAHPTLAASTNRIEVARGLKTQTGLRFNPVFTFQTENWPPAPPHSFSPSRDQDTFLYATQTFQTAGKRERRIEAADAVLRRAGYEREALERQIALRVKSAYWDAAAAERVREMLADSVAVYEEITGFHELRVREGAMAEVDLLRVRVETERVRISLNNAGLDATRSRIDLFREMGSPEFPSVRLVDPLEGTGPPPEPDFRQALAQRFEVRAAREALEAARAQMRVERAGVFPDVDVTFGYKRALGLHTLMGMVQVPVPFFDRNQGNVYAATAASREAEAILAATQALIRAEVEAAAADVAVRRRLVESTFPDLLEKASQSSEIARLAYREGGVDLLRLLDAERVRNDTYALYYQTLGEYRQSIVALEAALGMAP